MWSKNKWNRNDFNFSRSFRQDDEEEAIEFYLRLCFDVLFEVFRFGCRRKLTKLERVGHRFHWLVEKYFPDVPFLRLNLELRPRSVFTFLSIDRWDHPKNQESSKLVYKRYRYLLTIKSIPHNALTVYYFYNITIKQRYYYSGQWYISRYSIIFFLSTSDPSEGAICRMPRFYFIFKQQSFPIAA